MLEEKAAKLKRTIACSLRSIGAFAYSAQARQANAPLLSCYFVPVFLLLRVNPLARSRLGV
jgi:hypothetical protein